MAVWVIVLAPNYIGLLNFGLYAVNERSMVWLRLLVPRRAPLLVIPRRDGVPRDARPKTYWGLDLVDPRGLTTSHWVPPWCLLCWRGLAIPFYIGSFFQLNSSGSLNGSYFTYYTLWTFTLFGFTFLLGTALALADIVSKRPLKGAGEAIEKTTPPEQGWNFLQALYLTAVEIAAPAELFLCVFFWAVLYRNMNNPALGDQLFVHGLNNVFFVVDIFLSRIPFLSTHMLALLLWTSAYALVMWIYGGVTGNWPYSILTFSPVSMAFYVLMPIFLAIAFALYMGLVALREWIARRVYRQRQGVTHPSREQLEEEDMQCAADDVDGNASIECGTGHPVTKNTGIEEG